MKGFTTQFTLKVFALLLLLGRTFGLAAQEMVFTAGYGNNENFACVHMLPDQSVLVGGGAEDLDWIPNSVPRYEIQNTGGIQGTPSGKYAFLLHLSPSLDVIYSVVHFPFGALEEVSRIRTNVPQGATAELYISGRKTNTNPLQDGYIIAPLSHNYINGLPERLVWVYNANCPPRGTAISDYKVLQPWDVGLDGRIVLAEGTAYATTWAEIRRLSPDGIPELVPEWPAHWTANGREFNGPASLYPPDSQAVNPLVRSGIVMKAFRLGALRSWTREQYDQEMEDENNNPGRKGAFPDDYYYSGPCELNGPCAGGPGYTGYRIGSNPTQRVGGIAVDKRNGDIYFGYSTQSRLPDGLPDFEPAIVAMRFDGSMKWWARMYRETNDHSEPDQYIDAVDIDYYNNMFVIGARCHGNNTVNYWSGNALANNPSARGFQNRFTGTNGNIHISYLAKYDLESGKIMHGTYVAEYVEGTTSWGANYTNPLYSSWPNFNAGNPNVNTTRIQHMHVGTEGSVHLLAQGRRTFTTSNAYQKMPHPRNTAVAKGTWNHFYRIYTPDLSEVRYSTLLTGAWDTLTGQGGDNTTLRAVHAIQNGAIVVGIRRPSATGVAPNFIAAPPWADLADGTGTKALMAQFYIDSLPYIVNQPKVLVDAVQPTVQINPNPVEGNSLCRVQTKNFPVGEQLHIQAFSLDGKLAFTESFQVPYMGYTHSFRLPNLAKGLYNIRFQNSTLEKNKQGKTRLIVH